MNVHVLGDKYENTPVQGIFDATVAQIVLSIGTRMAIYKSAGGVSLLTSDSRDARTE